MSKIEECKRYIKKCEMLGTKMFEFEVDVDNVIAITKYIEDEEPERLVRIPDFVDRVNHDAFEKVGQEIKVIGKELKGIKFSYYEGKSIDISKLNTSKLTDMSDMFLNCINLEEINIDIGTSMVNSMGGMFYRCNKLKKLDTSNFDTTKVRDMGSMFCECCRLEKLDLSKFDTSSVTYMGYMFGDCEELKELNISNFDTSKVISMKEMFKGCTSLEKLDISNFNLTDRLKTTNMFSGCVNLRILVVNKQTKEYLGENAEIVALPKECEIRIKE